MIRMAISDRSERMHSNITREQQEQVMKDVMEFAYGDLWIKEKDITSSRLRMVMAYSDTFREFLQAESNGLEVLLRFAFRKEGIH